MKIFGQNHVVALVGRNIRSGADKSVAMLVMGNTRPSTPSMFPYALHRRH